MTTREPLPEKTPRLRSVLAIGAVLGGLCLLWGGVDLFRTMRQEQRNREVLQTITRIDRERAAPPWKTCGRWRLRRPG